MLAKTLQTNCDQIYHELEVSQKITLSSNVCHELEPLKKWLLGYLKHLELEIDRNLQILKENNPVFYPQVFNRTQLITRQLRFCNTQLMPALYRYNVSDTLCYRILNWLHDQHPKIKGKPFGVLDGSFAIAPTIDYPLVYFLPNSSQNILLHLPLFFHEIGHYFYQLHKPEMEDYIKEFQRKLKLQLTLPFQHNTKRFRQQERKIRTIVEHTWNNWIQELFCDAVGVSIGGAGFIHAFSLYLRMDGRNAFFIDERYLGGGSHPVPWIRVIFLAHWATEYGLIQEANQLSAEWDSIAKSLNIKKKFFGYYQDSYFDLVKECLSDMLTETEPICFNDYDHGISRYDVHRNNYIELINLAWREYHSNPSAYTKWETEIVTAVNNDL